MKVPTLEVDFYQKSLLGTSGISKPIVVTASDGNDYFIKNQNVYSKHDKRWFEFNAEFFQEFLTSKIAKFLNIPSPDIAIIRITDELLKDNPELQWEKHFIPGLHFATKKIENVQNNLLRNYEQLYRLGKPYTKRSWNDFFSSLYNKDAIPKIIALDLFTMNVDRFTNLNNLIISETVNGRKIISFDYGHCFFGPYYDIDHKPDKNLSCTQIDLDNSSEVKLMAQRISVYFRRLAIVHGEAQSGLGIIFSALQHQIVFKKGDVSINPFEKIIDQIEHFSDALIKEYIDSIPEEWIVGAAWQKDEYFEFLKRQKVLTRPILLKLISDGYFENFGEGGTLKWQTGKNTIIQS